MLCVVTPSPNALVAVTAADTPTIPLGVHHHDQSNDEGAVAFQPPAIPALMDPPAVTPTLVKKSFPQTSFTVDPANFSSSQLPSTNIILPLGKLLEFINTSFQCRKCHSVFGKRVTIERYGVASSLYFNCVN